MGRWNRPELDQLTAARDRALAGQPRLLLVDGAPGIGKSTLLDDLIAVCASFRVLTARAVDSAVASPYRLLAQWVQAEDLERLDPPFAAQRLRDALDERATLLVADDVQWADPESLAALAEVIDRADGDRLLIAIATRPSPPQVQPAWRHWYEHSDRVERLHLDGLDLETAAEVVRERQPRLEPATIRAMWEHTGGNPLHLIALATEFQPGDLARTSVLPAPTVYADTVRAVLRRMPPDVRIVARAVAILGDRWSPLPEVAELVDLGEVTEPVQQLVEAGLVELRPASAVPAVKVAQSLTRAAIYQDTPLPERRRLHRRASSIVTGQARVLDHRLAAADRYDDTLADDLETYARQLHDQRSYRLASHYLNAASGVTHDPATRESRFLESLFDALLAGDRQPAQAELDAVSESADRARRALILGMLAIWERRYPDGIAAIEAVGADEDIDAVTGYRLDVLLAWARLMMGVASDTIRADLRRAAGRGGSDDSIRRLAVLCENQLAGREVGDADPFVALPALPTHPAAVPIEATGALAWRGVVRASIGQFAEGAADLDVLIQRMHKGIAEFSSGTFHATLARARWFSGDWAMARLNLRLAVDLAGAYPHPMVAAIAPIIAIGDGDLAQADAQLAAAHAQIDAAPWVEAVDLLDVAQVQREHAAGTNSSVVYARLSPSIAAIRAGQLRKNLIWNLHAGLAATWAGRLDDAHVCVDAVAAAAVRTEWADAAANWLRALAAEAEGDGRTALRAIRSATASAPSEVPLYAAHMQVDHARLAHVLGDIATATRSLDQAAATYRRLGAATYLARIESLQRSLSAVPERRAGIDLSERERDVLTLLRSGMSYAQISSNLFITQSTVSFHLGRIYAKANVKSRHQLTELIRTDPAAFGLA